MDDALKSLRDIHLPSAVSMGYDAIGYTIVFSLSILILIGILGFYRYSYHSRQIKKQAILELKQLNQNNFSRQHFAAEISKLLKQVALLYYPREAIAPLYGEAWLNFLNQTSRRLDFNRAREALVVWQYESGDLSSMDTRVRKDDKQCPEENKYLFQLACAWIKQRGLRCLN